MRLTANVLLTQEKRTMHEACFETLFKNAKCAPQATANEGEGEEKNAIRKNLVDSAGEKNAKPFNQNETHSGFRYSKVIKANWNELNFFKHLGIDS